MSTEVDQIPSFAVDARSSDGRVAPLALSPRPPVACDGMGEGPGARAASATPDAPRLAPAPLHRIVIEPPRGWLSLNLAEVWRYRDLLAMLVWRDFSTRYRQSILGAGWAIVRPVLSVLVFTVIFGMVAKLPSDGIPYPLFSFAAMMPWLYFSTALTNATNSVVLAQNLLTKVYFPRLVLPLASIVCGLGEFAIQFVILIGLMLWYGVVPTWAVLLVPLFIVECMVVSLALGLWLTALNVKYRDIGQVVPFAVQIWMYLTPIVYSSSMVPVRFRALYSLNPLVGVVDGFRWAVLGQSAPDWSMLAISSSVVLVLFLTGLFYFRRVEQDFADII
jgi:lipopolysaccharide transport system permease protein